MRFFSAVTLRRKSLRTRISAILLFFAIVFIITGVSPYIDKWVNRPISVVKVKGTFKYLTNQEIRKKLTPVATTNFFDLKLTKVRDVLLSLPWVNHVDLKKVWPDKLLVYVFERIPVVRWNNTALLDDTGKVFVPENIVPFNHLPLLQGNMASQVSVWNAFLWLRKQIAPLAISEFSIDKNGLWACKIQGVLVILGTSKQQERIVGFKNIYKTTLAKVWAQIQKIDLRYSDGAAILWKKNARRS